MSKLCLSFTQVRSYSNQLTSQISGFFWAFLLAGRSLNIAKIFRNIPYKDWMVKPILETGNTNDVSMHVWLIYSRIKK